MKPSDGKGDTLTSKLKNVVKILPLAGAIRKLDILSQDKKERLSHQDDIGQHDQKTLLESDGVFAECDKFLAQARETIYFSKQNQKNTKTITGLQLTTKLNNWRGKRKGNQLFNSYEALLEKLDAADHQMKYTIDESLKTNSSLILQSAHLKSRLKACVEYNKKQVELSKPVIDEGHELMASIKLQQKHLQEMLTFLDEVIVMTQNQPYIPWAMRAGAPTTGPPMEPLVEVKRDSLIKRIANLEKLLVIVQANVDVMHKRYDTFVSNLTHCMRAVQSMNKLLHKIHTLEESLHENMHECALVPPQQQGTQSRDNPILSNNNKSPSSQRKSRHSDNKLNIPSAQLQQQQQRDVDRGDPDFDVSRYSEIALKHYSEATFTKEHHQQNPADAFAPSTASSANVAADAEKEDVISIGKLHTQSDTSIVISSSHAHRSPTAHEVAVHTLEGSPENKPQRHRSHTQDSQGSIESGRGSELMASKASPTAKDGAAAAKEQRRPQQLDQAALDVMEEEINFLESPIPQHVTEAYDHSNCSDCSCVYAMASECLMQLAASHYIAQEGTKRTVKLVQYRERMKEIAERLESLDWGGAHHQA